MLTGPASRPTRASPISAGRTGCGRRTRPRRRRRRSSTTSPIPRSAGRVAEPAVEAGVDGQPNAGHLAMVELERQGKLHALVTQNVDGLHQRAGTRPRSSRCTARSAGRSAGTAGTGGRWPRRSIVCGPARTTRRAWCAAGSSRATRSLRPDPRARGDRAGDAVSEECDLLLAVGSTLRCTRPPTACRWPGAGARVVIVNAGRPRWTSSPTPCSAARSARSSRRSSSRLNPDLDGRLSAWQLP